MQIWMMLDSSAGLPMLLQVTCQQCGVSLLIPSSPSEPKCWCPRCGTEYVAETSVASVPLDAGHSGDPQAPVQSLRKGVRPSIVRGVVMIVVMTMSVFAFAEDVEQPKAVPVPPSVTVPEDISEPTPNPMFEPTPEPATLALLGLGTLLALGKHRRSR